jgi:hypothetical protein
LLIDFTLGLSSKTAYNFPLYLGKNALIPPTKESAQPLSILFLKSGKAINEGEARSSAQERIRALPTAKRQEGENP